MLAAGAWRTGTVFCVRRKGLLLSRLFRKESLSIWSNHVSFLRRCVPYSSPLTLSIALETSDWAWAYFIDFENRLLETWAFGMLLDIVPFEQLVKDGVEKYVTSVERYERVASGEGEDEDEDDWRKSLVEVALY
jgi:hypothetical protein